MQVLYGLTPPQEYKIDIDNEVFFSIPKLARFLGIPTKEVEEIIKSGELPFFRLGVSVVVAKSDLEKYLAINRVYKEQKKDIKDRINLLLNIKENIQTGNI